MSVALKAPKWCGAKTRKGGGATCALRAGWGTDHFGQGRCRFHGGATPVKHGRYSTVTRDRVRELIEQFEGEDNPLDMRPELAAARALFLDFVERYDANRDALLAWHASFGSEKETAKPRQILDIVDAQRALSEITKIVKRIEDIGAQNAISRADFYRVLTEMGRAVDLVVQDEAERDGIRDAWLGIRLA